MHKLKQHPLSAVFPAMKEEEYESLKAHIGAHGQQSAIATLDGEVLDGWHRYRACAELGIQPKLREIAASVDAVAFVTGQNLDRRHMDASQRAMVAAKIANLGHGRSEKRKEATLPLTPLVTVTEAAKSLKVSPRSVKDARVVLTDKKETAKVTAGEKTVSAAAKEVRAKKAEKEVQRDSTGYAIPESRIPLWNRRGEVREILSAISSARAVLQRVMKSQLDSGEADPLFEGANINGAHGHLCNAWTMVSMALPHAVCPTCQGRASDSCKVCSGRGLVPKHTFENAFPPELIAVREKSCVK